jgi:hypothetical protein
MGSLNRELKLIVSIPAIDRINGSVVPAEPSAALAASQL